MQWNQHLLEKLCCLLSRNQTLGGFVVPAWCFVAPVSVCLLLDEHEPVWAQDAGCSLAGCHGAPAAHHHSDVALPDLPVCSDFKSSCSHYASEQWLQLELSSHAWRFSQVFLSATFLGNTLSMQAALTVKQLLEWGTQILAVKCQIQVYSNAAWSGFISRVLNFTSVSICVWKEAG